MSKCPECETELWSETVEWQRPRHEHTDARCKLALKAQRDAAVERAEKAERGLTEVVHSEPARMGHVLDVVESPGTHPIGTPNSVMRRAQEIGNRLRAEVERLREELKRRHNGDPSIPMTPYDYGYDQGRADAAHDVREASKRNDALQLSLGDQSRERAKYERENHALRAEVERKDEALFACKTLLGARCPGIVDAALAPAAEPGAARQETSEGAGLDIAAGVDLDAEIAHLRGQGPDPFPPAVERARLDADRTAKPKTVLTAPVQGSGSKEGTCFAGAATAIVDTETGKRTELHIPPAAEDDAERVKNAFDRAFGVCPEEEDAPQTSLLAAAQMSDDAARAWLAIVWREGPLRYESTERSLAALLLAARQAGRREGVILAAEFAVDYDRQNHCWPNADDIRALAASETKGGSST